MMYGFLRLAFFGIIFAVLSFLIVKKSKRVNKKRILTIIFILCLLLASVSFLFPAENLFFSFGTPESVFRYVQGGKVEDVVCGNASCMLIYRNTSDSAGGHFIALRSTEGYKIPSSALKLKIA